MPLETCHFPCPVCRGKAIFLRRGYVEPSRRPSGSAKVSGVEVSVAELRASRAEALAATAASEDESQHVVEQEGADAETAQELHDEEVAEEAAEEAAALQKVAAHMQSTQLARVEFQLMESFGSHVISESCHGKDRVHAVRACPAA
jgi:hypothetical protein